MSDPYDVLVIGAGTAAMVASMRVRDAGWRVAVVDSRPLGGTCALRGCDPKKMLIGGTSAVQHARRMEAKAPSVTPAWTGASSWHLSQMALTLAPGHGRAS